MKKSITIALALLVCLTIMPVGTMADDTHYLHIDKTTVPDPMVQYSIFEQYYNPYEDSFNPDYGFWLSKEQVESLTELSILHYDPVYTLQGIELFPNLKELDCSMTDISELDISKNTSLTELDCSHCKNLTKLTVGSNCRLQTLNCSDCNSALLKNSFPQSSTLLDLYCRSCGLTELDPGKYPALELLDCGENNLTSLDISKNSELYSLGCGENRLTVLDVSLNPKLANLACDYNQISMLDLSKNTALQALSCSDNQLTELDISRNPELEYLECSDNQLKTLDVSKAVNLTLLSCSGNPLKNVDVSKLAVLEDLECSRTQLTALDVSRNPELEYLDCSNNQLKTLDVSKNADLQDLNCGYNQLTTLDVSQNGELDYLDCSGNRLTALDLKANTELDYLFCKDNRLTALDLGSNIDLYQLSCRGNHIAVLDLQNNPELCSFGDNDDGDLSQVIENQQGTEKNGIYSYDLSQLVGKKNLSRVTLQNSKNKLDANSGTVTFSEKVQKFVYTFDTGKAPMDVTVNLTYGDEAPATEPVVLNGVSLTLEGQITVNFFVKVPEGSTAKTVKLEYAKGGSKTYTLDKTQKFYDSKNDEYKLAFPNIPAKEMTVPITLKAYDAKGKQLKLKHYKNGALKNDQYSYCVADWARNILSDSSKAEKTQYLAKALLNYGDYAQKYFAYNTSNPANPNGYLASEMGGVSAVAANDAVIPADAKEKIGYSGASLILEGATSIRLYFTQKVEAKNASGKAYTLQQSGKEWYVEIPNIASKDLDEKYVVIVTKDGKDYRFEYSALSYANGRLTNAKAKTDIKNLCKALYRYNDAANKYFK